MKAILVAAILQACPGWDYDRNGRVITTICQEDFYNCVVDKKGEITQKEIDRCQEKFREKRAQSGRNP